MNTMSFPARDVFQTTRQGLQRELPPMRLFEKAKRFGTWNPSELDFSRDVDEWQQLSTREQTVLLHLTTLFQGGEEAVTLDLLPLIGAIAREGRLEEELFLTTFLFEEAKHTDFFDRFLREVTGTDGDLSHFQNDAYRVIFHQALPTALQALHTDSSPAALARASATYNMVVEGMLAETGYHAYHTMLTEQDLLPGLRSGIALLKQDESRHIAYGVYLLSRLVAADPTLWLVIQEQMNTLLPVALGVVQGIFADYDDMPFGLEESDFTNYAFSQFQKRVERIEKAQGVSLNEVIDQTQAAWQEDDEALV